ncbi:MAG: hypothetical protein V4736_04375 [Bdellovibrionota bacterium]
MSVRILTVLLLSALSFLLPVANAQIATNSDREEAKWLLERLTGVKWRGKDPVLEEVTRLIKLGQRKQAAQLATQQPQFLNVLVKQFALQMSTQDETRRIPLNDFAAMVMGHTRDGGDARELLYGNFSYKGDPEQFGSYRIQNNAVDDIGLSNDHYDSLESSGIDVGKVLTRIDEQMLIVNMNGANISRQNPDPAGLLTSRAWVQAHAVAGTNRRLVEYTFRQFMCVKIEEWADPLANEARIGRDIDRFPGGDNKVFQNTCRACHTVMDGFRGAFANLDYNGRPTNSTFGNTTGADKNLVVNKMNKNEKVYPGGYVTVDNSWVNNADRPGNSALFGWRKPASGEVTHGSGIAQFGRLVANSQRFSQCMAQRVFDSVCKKQLTPTEKAAMLVRLGSQFEQNGYSLRKQFITTATDVQCK